MNRSIETRLQRLESQQQDHVLGDAVIAFYEDGVFVRAERNGEPYAGSLEGHSVLSRVNFVTAKPRADEEV